MDDELAWAEEPKKGCPVLQLIGVEVRVEEVQHFYRDDWMRKGKSVELCSKRLKRIIDAANQLDFRKVEDDGHSGAPARASGADLGSTRDGADLGEQTDKTRQVDRQ